MCGLAGIVAWEARFAFGPELLERLSVAVAHRGPDGQGVYLNHTAAPSPGRPQCGLVHRRLAILDLDERSLQPFESAGGRQWLVFNGEIYNYRELRDEISRIRADYPWRTTGDTELLLAAWQVWGPRCVEKFDGMFAFAVWEPESGGLFLARDRMGQKPLFYALARSGDSIGAIAFASELSVLRLVPWFDAALNTPAVGDYFRWGYIPAPTTIFRGAHKLPPAHRMSVRRWSVEKERYFDPNVAGERPGDAVAATRELVRAAVRRQLVADVPVGCFLSGGIDSSIVAAAMQSAVGKDQQVLTFCVGFDDSRYDESPYAEAVARHLGTSHRMLRVTPDAAADLPRLAIAFGEPFADSSALPTHYLSRATREFVKVALSGDGGDELFAGYDRYRAMRLSHRIRHWPSPWRQLASSRLWQRLPGRHPKGKLTRLKRLLAAVDLPAPRRYAAYMRLFDEALIGELLNVELLAASEARADWLAGRYADCSAGRDLVAAALATDRVIYLPDDLLVKLDRASMLHALEVRSPFMDPALVTFAAGLRGEEVLDHRPKRLLREAFAADLPPQVFARHKMGFALPIGQWLRGSLQTMLRDLTGSADSFTHHYLRPPAVVRLIDEHAAGQADHDQRLYALLMLELWWRSLQQ